MSEPLSAELPPKPQRKPRTKAAPRPAADPLAAAREALARLSPEQIAALLGKPITPAIAAPAPARADPARIARVPNSARVHWTTLYPQMRRRDPITGGPAAERMRTGGQFSARRLTMVNKFTGAKRHAVVPMHRPSSQWGIESYERVMDPDNYPGDPEPGNIEVIFDFEDELHEFMKAFGVNSRIDPLRANDSGSAFGIKAGEVPAVFTVIDPPPYAPVTSEPDEPPGGWPQ